MQFCQWGNCPIPCVVAAFLWTTLTISIFVLLVSWKMKHLYKIKPLSNKTLNTQTFLINWSHYNPFSRTRSDVTPQSRPKAHRQQRLPSIKRLTRVFAESCLYWLQWHYRMAHITYINDIISVIMLTKSNILQAFKWKLKKDRCLDWAQSMI